LIATPLGNPVCRLVAVGLDDSDRYSDPLMRDDAEDPRFQFFEDPPEFMIARRAGAAVADGHVVLPWSFHGNGNVKFAARGNSSPIMPNRSWENLPSAANAIGAASGRGSALMREAITLAHNWRPARLELKILG
jgi:hypothetical protein